MATELDTLKERRAELEHRIHHLKGTRAALYTPGITLVPQDHKPPNSIDEEVAQLEAAIVELDAEIDAASKP